MLNTADNNRQHQRQQLWQQMPYMTLALDDLTDSQQTVRPSEQRQQQEWQATNDGRQQIQS